MSDIECSSDSEKMNEIVYYNGNDEDMFRYLEYFRNNFPLCPKEIDNIEVKEHIESDYNHFISVVTSFLMYEWDCIKDLARIERNYYGLLQEDRELLRISNIEDEINKFRNCINANQNFLKLMLSPDLYYDQIESNNNNINNNRLNENKNFKTYTNKNINYIPNTTLNNLCKVKATLRQFVRDWSEHGTEEREESYGPIIQALKDYLPINTNSSSSKKIKVLIPGAGLGRLLFEVARLGYSCQGNEISYAMLLGSNFALNYMFKVNSIVIHPYVLSLSNRPRKEDNFRPIHIPDVCVNEHIKQGHDLSMCAGDFVEIYSKQTQAWDAILTCFFLDTAKNIITYIRTITNLLPPNGVWINLGPLLYHYSGLNNVISIEPSWEEIKRIISKYFKIVKEEWRNATYTSNNNSMFKIVYKCIFFVAIRNQVGLSS
ncbi:N2227-like protein family protein [Cryptosporidium meleagridis]|uniref:carnosine N-methyltransferase n=1 Tax=Cryptosporidium meleagridis TaxID=93969 RepID=A0A2P4YZL9_9CRYT|nr:N2227-like protein family protein [Cryptosporidium meleagridis]